MDSKGVFINCPFDDEYLSLLRVILFETLYFRFTPKIASEDANCDRLRLKKIDDLILESKYSIHDLSRMKVKREEENKIIGEDIYFRLNMSFELGIDHGYRLRNDICRKDNKSLILEAEKYSSQKAISDIAGFDVKAHKNDPEELVRILRDWYISIDEDIYKDKNRLNMRSPKNIWVDFNFFYSDFYDRKRSVDFSDDEIKHTPVKELIQEMSNWISQHVN